LPICRHLTPEERQALFSEWVYLASWAHGAVQFARDMIASLPRPWVVAHLEQEAEPYLQSGTDEEYRRFLELFSGIDTELAQRLARRAALHSNPEIREAGEDFLR